MVAAAVGEEDGEVEGGGLIGNLSEVDGEGGGLAVELGEDPLAVDEAAVFADAGEVVVHLEVEDAGGDTSVLLEVEGLDGGRRGVGGYDEVAEEACVGFEPTAGLALDATLDDACGERREVVAAEAADDLLLGLDTDDEGHAYLIGAVRRIGAEPGSDGDDGREIAAVFLDAVQQEVVVVGHACRHVDLVFTAADGEGPAHQEAVGEEVIGWMFGYVVHGDETLEAVAHVEAAHRLVAVVVGDGDGDAVQGGVAIDEADAAVAVGACGTHGVAGQTSREDVALLGGEVVRVVELGVDGACVAKGDFVHLVLEEGLAVDPDVDAVVAIAEGRALGHVCGIDTDIETAQDIERIGLGAEDRVLTADIELEGFFEMVDAAVFIDREDADAADGGRNGVAECHAILQGVEGLLGACVANLVMEMRAAAHAAVAGVCNEVAAADREDVGREGGVEGVALMGGLILQHILGDGAVIAVEVQIDGGDVASVVDVEHLAAIVGGDAEAGDIAVGRGIDRGANAVVATNAEVDATVIVVATDFGESARRCGREPQGEVQLRGLLALGVGSDKKEREKCYGEEGFHICDL